MDQEPNLTLVNSLKDDEEIEYIKNVLEKDFNLFETKEEGKKREEILVSLKECVKQAVKNIYKSKGKTDEEANTAGGGVFTFGSYRLGIAGPGDDIDVLCIAPAIDTNDNNEKCNSRIELIEAIAKQLKLLKNKKEITQIYRIFSNNKSKHNELQEIMKYNLLYNIIGVKYQGVLYYLFLMQKYP